MIMCNLLVIYAAIATIMFVYFVLIANVIPEYLEEQDEFIKEHGAGPLILMCIFATFILSLFWPLGLLSFYLYAKHKKGDQK